MGVPHAQIIGTYGERCTSGSNLNGAYGNGNLWDANGALNHGADAHDPQHWPTDPLGADEAAMIAQSTDLTPSCSGVCFWCTGNGEMTPILDATGWPDYILVGPYGGMWPLTGTYGDPYVLGNATARGVKVITILDNYNDGALGVGTDLATRAGYIEITKRYEELATFLGATANLDSEKRAFCAEMNNFKATAAAAATRDIRAMGILAPNGPVTDGVASGAMYGANVDQVTMMLQELGMQIYERDATLGAWGASLDADALPYPVDFWLYDARSALDFVSDAFATAWPHPAVVAKQYSYWPHGGWLHTFQHGTDILKLVGTELAKASQIAGSRTDTCTVVADITDVSYRVNGLGAGKYACPKPVDYDWCLAYPSPTDSAYLARPGVAVAAGAAVAALL